MKKTVHKPDRRRLRQRTRELRRTIAAMDFVASGTLHVRTKTCGRPNCRCAVDPEARHGPYYEWSRHQEGRLVHWVVPVALVPRVKQALANYREIKALLAEWERETVKELLEPEPK